MIRVSRFPAKKSPNYDNCHISDNSDISDISDTSPPGHCIAPKTANHSCALVDKWDKRDLRVGGDKTDIKDNADIADKVGETDIKDEIGQSGTK